MGRVLHTAVAVVVLVLTVISLLQVNGALNLPYRPKSSAVSKRQAFGQIMNMPNASQVCACAERNTSPFIARNGPLDMPLPFEHSNYRSKSTGSST